MSIKTDFKTRLFSLKDITDPEQVAILSTHVAELEDLHQTPLMKDLFNRMTFYTKYVIPMLYSFIKTGTVDLADYKAKVKQNVSVDTKKWRIESELLIAFTKEEVDEYMSKKGKKAILFIPELVKSICHPLGLQLSVPSINCKLLRMSKSSADYAYRMSQLSLTTITLILEEYKAIDDELHELTVGMLQEAVVYLTAPDSEVIVNFLPERGAEIWCRSGDTAVRIIQWASVAGVAINGDNSLISWLDAARSGLMISMSNMNQNIGLALSSDKLSSSTFVKHLLSNYSGLKKGQRLHKWFMRQLAVAAVKYKELRK